MRAPPCLGVEEDATADAGVLRSRAQVVEGPLVVLRIDDGRGCNKLSKPVFKLKSILSKHFIFVNVDLLLKTRRFLQAVGRACTSPHRMVRWTVDEMKWRPGEAEQTDGGVGGRGGHARSSATGDDVAKIVVATIDVATIARASIDCSEDVLRTELRREWLVGTLGQLPPSLPTELRCCGGDRQYFHNE